MKQDQRALLAEKLCDAGNLAAGALVFGQILGDRYSYVVALAGIAAWLILIGWALALSAGGKR